LVRFQPRTPINARVEKKCGINYERGFLRRYVMQRWLLLVCVIWLVPARAHSTTYYVAKTGSDSNTCTQAQSGSTPKLTIGAGITCLAGADTLIIGAGTYAEGIDDTIPAGTSTSAETTLRSASGATVTLLPSSGIGPASLHAVYITHSNITIDGLVIDGSNGISLPFRWHGTATGNVLQNSIVRNGSSNCVTVQGSVTNATVSNNVIHDCGTDTTHHGVYLWNSGHLVEGNEIYNISGMGVHLFLDTGGVSDNVIRNNYIHDNGSRGILIGSGDNNLAYNNIIVANGFANNAGGLGMTSGAGGVNNRAYNNTIYANYQCINIDALYSDSKVKNNLCLSNTSNLITDSGSGTILANNLLSTDTTLVVDAANNQFTPRAGSSLIDAGVDVGLPFVGSAPDQGAIEFVPTASNTSTAD
jgi:parallel beta-helix repeat protein